MPFRVDRLPSLRGSNARPCILGLDPNQRCNPIGPYLFHLIPLNPVSAPLQCVVGFKCVLCVGQVRFAV